MKTVNVLSLFSEQDVYFFKEGKHCKLYEKLGAHSCVYEGKKGVYFAVWAPNAAQVFVKGNFNGWNSTSHPLFHRWDSSGIWEGFIPGIGKGEVYKYHIISKIKGIEREKGDPFAFFWEKPPHTASVVWDHDYIWKDGAWNKKRKICNHHEAPIAIYEVHLGSWRRKRNGEALTYLELAEQLPSYVKELGFTHVEFLPVMEHPFFGSWGYQTVGYFAPSSRYGTPQDLMCLIDSFHREGIGVILDWVPSHFPVDVHGLSLFDGTHLYEHQDPQKGFHPDWKSAIFNYGRHEVRSFLLSSAFFWLDCFHADGIRVDAVASMLYLDYSRKKGEWTPNIYGGNENLEAVSFLKELNTSVYAHFPDVQMIAEESTAWPQVSRPVYLGGLGFGMKWNMGWMHDTLVYFSKDPVYRKHHHNDLLFSMIYAFSENFILPLSHDEVVHGKASLLSKMPGDDWQKFANLRLLLGYMYFHPGKKLLFMGQEFGQRGEWNHEGSIEWHLLQYAPHEGLKRWVKDLNSLYRSQPALYEGDFEWNGFEWVDCSDWNSSIISFLRKAKHKKEELLIVCNFTPVPRKHARIGVNHSGEWVEVLNSDSQYYGGSNMGNLGKLKTRKAAYHDRPYSLTIVLPPLAVVCFKHECKKPV